MNIKNLKLLTGIFLLGVVLFAAGRTENEQAVKAAATQDVSGTERYDYAFQVLELVNKERASVGASSLNMDKDLLSAAMLRTAETVVSFSHTRPNGEMCYTASSKMSGENIAMGSGGASGTPAQVMNQWMNSSGHKSNILDTSFQSIGIGCIVTSSGTYWVQCFGRGTAQTISQPANAQVTYRVAKDTSSQTKLVSSTAAGNGGSTGTTTATPKPENTPAGTINQPAGATTRPAGQATAAPSGTQNSGENISQNSSVQWKIKLSKAKITLKWKKMTGISGYEIQISNKKNFKQKQTYSLKKSRKQKVITKYKGKKLELGKAYYVRIRSFKNDNGTKVYGSWSGRIRCQM